MPLYTLGHSGWSLAGLEQLLRAHGISVLADVRRFPRSRRSPHFDDQRLALLLPEAGVRYAWLGRLGGRRHGQAGALTNAGWRNPSFRAFADCMQTDEFTRGLAELLDLARSGPTAVMCAEALPWRCHRSLIADARTARGFMDEPGRIQPLLDDDAGQNAPASRRCDGFEAVGVVSAIGGDLISCWTARPGEVSGCCGPRLFEGHPSCAVAERSRRAWR